MAAHDGSEWESMTWKRRLETSGPSRRGVPARGPGGETDGICMPGELTDKGRETSLAFGKMLRRRYVHQLNLLPGYLSDASLLYIRTTEVPRVVESMPQILYGLYPPDAKKTAAPWEIAIRSGVEETLLPKTKSCARLAELVREFSREASKKWNGSDEMKYLSEKIGVWMPDNKPLALDSGSRLSAVMDSINATAAHGPDTRLPDEFYDEKVQRTIERIVMDQDFHGYSTSRELRTLGMGPLVGDMVLKMVDQVDWDRGYGIGSRPPPRLSLLGCHDRTIGAVLASIGCLDVDERWPRFTSHIVFELFRKRSTPDSPSTSQVRLQLPKNDDADLSPTTGQGTANEPRDIGRRSVKDLTTEEVHRLDEYFVRVRYNDRTMIVPGCREDGKNLDGDAGFCTLLAFKSIVDKFTPRGWKLACSSNLGTPSDTTGGESAGY